MIQAAGTRPAELVGGREEVSDQSPLLLKLSAIYTGASPQGQTLGGDPARQPPAMALGRQLAAAAKHSCKKQILSFPSHKYLPWARLLDTDGRCRCSALCRILHLARCYQQINKSPQSSHEEGDSYCFSSLHGLPIADASPQSISSIRMGVTEKTQHHKQSYKLFHSAKDSLGGCNNHRFQI